jgi:aryl-alcohol dehydrogenase-like predicted oxidoreductase
MEYRELGATGLSVSTLGVGTWAMGGDEWGESDDQQSIEVLRAAVDAGVNLIDTADIYGLGRSEELVAEAVPADRDVVVVTKVGWDLYTDPPVVGGARRRYDREYVEHAFAESCRRLRRDRLDVYLLHNPSRQDLATSDGLAVLRELKRDGKVRCIGASVGAEDDAMAAIEAGLDVLEVPFNVARSWARRVLPHAAAAGIGVIAREPLERGLLTGKYGPDATFPEGDHRADKGRDWLLAGLEHAARVSRIADERGCSALHAALGFPLSHPEVASTVVGARSVAQLHANVSAAATRLSQPELSRLSS